MDHTCGCTHSKCSKNMPPSSNLSPNAWKTCLGQWAHARWLSRISTSYTSILRKHSWLARSGGQYLRECVIWISLLALLGHSPVLHNLGLLTSRSVLRHQATAAESAWGIASHPSWPLPCPPSCTRPCLPDTSTTQAQIQA